MFACGAVGVGEGSFEMRSCGTVDPITLRGTSCVLSFTWMEEVGT